MDLTFLSEAIVPVIVGICLCVGYVIKNSVPKLDNRYIPVILAFVGLALNIWIANTFSAEVILGGLFSGLSATGLHQAFRNVIDRNKGE